MLRAFIVRRRVPIGFLCAAVAYGLATPTRTSILIGLLIALPGEALRVWASGHLEKGREITRSGPYRLVRHPLYLGSSILGLGFIVAAHSWASAVVVAAYQATALIAAMQSEEAVLDARFAGAYTAYRDGRAAPVDRPFSLARVRANHEPRTMLGFVAAFALLMIRALW